MMIPLLILAAIDLAEVRSTAVDFLLDRQENKVEWPYRGVYRVRGSQGLQNPIGYRVGGTAIVMQALLTLPADDVRAKDRNAAMERARSFLVEAMDHPGMAHVFSETYDVRGWGWCYALETLIMLRRDNLVPEPALASHRQAERHALGGILATEIQSGGWNYSRRSGFATGTPGEASPFMTVPTLRALRLAMQHGHVFPKEVLERGDAALLRSRTKSGGQAYAGSRPDPVPGSTGRMLAVESYLVEVGSEDLSKLRGALDSFFAHWERLEERRQQRGTHVAPFGVAPYYFMYAHDQASRAIMLLPRRERGEYARLLRARLEQVRDPGGTWNDRDPTDPRLVRTANYGTAMALMSLDRIATVADPREARNR
ncbi:MAG: hypothetical protein AAGK34_04290 [Planctomycetota bacterium]|jgi:hypothetical protein|nr:MAG: hypothetical protein EVA77_00570 [Phycisphaeraceae bacterium]